MHPTAFCIRMLQCLSLDFVSSHSVLWHTLCSQAGKYFAANFMVSHNRMFNNPEIYERFEILVNIQYEKHDSSCRSSRFLHYYLAMYCIMCNSDSRSFAHNRFHLWLKHITEFYKSSPRCSLSESFLFSENVNMFSNVCNKSNSNSNFIYLKSLSFLYVSSPTIPQIIFSMVSLLKEFARDLWFWNIFSIVLHQGSATCFNFSDIMCLVCAP